MRNKGMPMLRRITALLLTLLLVFGMLPVGHAASGVTIVDVNTRKVSSGELNIAVRVDNEAAARNASATDFAVQVNGVNVTARNATDTSVGYTFVIDATNPYKPTYDNWAECVRLLTDALLTIPGDNDGVRFIWVTNAAKATKYYSAAEAQDVFGSSFSDLRNQNETAAALADGIASAVEAAAADNSQYAYHRIIVISDTVDERSSTTLDSIRQFIDSTRPVQLYCVALWNSKFDEKSAAAMRSDMRLFVENAGGVFALMDYYREPAVAFGTQAANIKSQLQSHIRSVVMLSLNLYQNQEQLSETVNQRPVLKVTYGGRSTEFSGYDLHLNEMPTPVPTFTAAPYRPQATATVAPTPAPYAIYGDERESSVRTLQDLLKKQGWYDGEINGNFDSATLEAYERLCQANDLAVSMENGKVVIWLDEYFALLGNHSLVTPTPSATPRPVFFATDGDRGSDNVRLLQEFLTAEGWYQGEINGDFDTATRRAYEAMCAVNRLTPETFEGVMVISEKQYRLFSSDTTLVKPTPTPTPTPTPEPSPTPVPTPFAVFNGSGENVGELKKYLKDLGWYTGEIDSRFNLGTRDAYLAYLKASGLEATYENGRLVITNEEFGMMTQESNPATPTPTPTPTPSPTPLPEFFAKDGERDSANVEKLQEFLKEQGWYEDEINGDFNTATRRAYEAMCRANAFDPETFEGVMVVSEKQFLLFSTDTTLVTPTPKPTATPTPTPAPTPFAVMGENSANVGELQAFLKDLGWYTGEIDNRFNNSTREAYLAYLKAGDMDANYEDGRLIITNADYQRMVNDMNPATPTPTPSPTPSPTPAPVFFAMDGERDSANVEKLQEFLKEQGWYTGEINGDFNTATRRAYEAMCRANAFDTETFNGVMVVSEKQYLLFSSDKTLVTP
ncbi:MAG: peptidoglycan-binding protein, partial [Clostridia bacterium]|nr:peptidoglycan-binding protein [Clostridia bacterium]